MKYIIDLDGTLLNGAKANLDAVEFINELNIQNIDYLIMTNSIKSPKLIKQRLATANIQVELDRILNPISAINSYIADKNITKVYAVGSRLELEQINVTQDILNPELVILLDFEKENFGFSELQNIFEFSNKGVPIITASKSLFYLKNGKKNLDTGAFVTLLEAVSDTKIKVLGKPSREYFEAGINILDANPDEITVIGDDWSTDVKGALGVGCNAILVKSGKYIDGDEEKIEGHKFVESLMKILD